ncbi:hypothetical protein [Arenicella xantha]|uniref:O-antigen ligase-like membrane protein n=1 Tax=Arenicella xantha TaxID=644221 RepID=A0A395JMQ5_9GAMM|nr:hypothetical protein [Arenicella xantha]RBP52941.1 hypothetical protein DFR28_101325 [Arenicella xantha]
MTAIRILIFSFLIPDEFSLTLGSLVLSGYRIVLIALAPYILWLMLKRGHDVDWNHCDVMACIVFIWPTLAFGLNTGLTAAIESGGVLALEMGVPYLLVRLNVNNYDERKKLATSFLTMVTILFLVGLPEAITGQHFTHEIAAQLTGQSYTGIADQRYGIWRAIGPMDHAILFGTLCASFVVIAITLAQRQRKFWPAVFFAGGGAVISASSAPILAILVQLGMLTWALLLRRHANKWWLLLLLFLVFYVFVDILSNRDPVRVMFSYLLINPATGYARYYMWINGIEVLTQSTWGMVFGYGYDISIFDVIDDFYSRNLMQNTVDSYWLVLMLRYGATMAALFAVFLLFVLRRSLKQTRRLSKRKDRRLMQAWFISAFAMTLIASTVHFWGQMACVYVMVLAACVGRTPPRRKRSGSGTTTQHKIGRRVSPSPVD